MSTPTTVPANPAATQPAKAPANKSSGGSLSNGAVAGVVIGVAVVIGLLAAALTFLIMKRQERGRRRREHYEAREADNREKQRSNKQPANNDPEPSILDKYLPQSADDRTVGSKVNAIFDQVEVFVENFYSSTRDKKVPLSESDLALYDSPHLPKELTRLLPEYPDAQILIKHALSHALFSKITTTSSSQDSILPADISCIPRSLKAESAKTSPPGASQLLYRWRTLTAYLRPDPTTDKEYLQERDRKIAATIDAFIPAFLPWASARHSQEDLAHSLHNIFQQAASLGFFLFSQAAELNFHWPQKDQLNPGSLPLTPALLKSADQRGQKVSPVQVMATSRTAKLY